MVGRLSQLGLIAQASPSASGNQSRAGVARSGQVKVELEVWRKV